MLLMMLTLACRSSEPVLSGVSVSTAQPQSESSYSLAEGVEVDASYLLGKNLDQVRGIVSQQLGDVLERKELGGGQGTALIFEHAELREIDGRLYQLRVDLPRPTRRQAALRSLNVPTQIDRPALLSDEIRVQWHAGFERVRMGRAERHSELIIWVELRKFDPRSG